MSFNTYNPKMFKIYLLCIPIYLLPLLLLTGPFLPDLVVSVSALTFIYIIFKKEEYQYLNNKFFFLFFLYYIYLIITSLSSTDIYHSLSSSLFYFRFGIFSLLICYLIENNKFFVKHFFIFFLATFIIVLGDGVVQYIFGKNLIGLSMDSTRLRLTLDDKIILGGYISRMIPLLLGMIILLLVGKKLKIITFSSLLISSCVVVILTGERTALGIIILVSIMTLLFTKQFNLRIKIASFILSILFMLSILISNQSVYERMYERTVMQFTNSKDVKDEIKFDNLVIFSSIHHSFIMTAINMFTDKPLIGHGPNQFRNKCSLEKYSHDLNSCSTHPHNTYVQLLSETGLIGTIPVITIFIFLLYHLIFRKNYKSKEEKISLENYDYQTFIIMSLLITLWPFFPTQNFFNNYINIIYYLPLGFYLQTLIEFKK